MTPARGRKRGVLLLLLAVALAGAVAAAGQLLPGGMVLDDAGLEAVAAVVGDPAEPVDVARATSGVASCPVVAGEQETPQLEIASASADAGSEVVVTAFVDGRPVPGEPQALEAGGSLVVDVPPEQRTSPVQVEWRGGPVVAQYRIADGAESAVATCQPGASDVWHLVGFDTSRGNRSLLYLFNPYGQDAVVRLTFGTPEGPVDLVIADEITVPAGRVEVRDLADFRPETGDLAVTVTAQAGRVVAQGQLTLGPAGEGLDAVRGRALVPALPAASEQALVPDALVDETTSSWVTVYNPSTRAAAVQLQVSTPLGTAVQLAGELTVPAGGTTRVDLAGTSALPRMGVQVTSLNEVGVVATRTSAVQDGDRSEATVAAAAPTAARSWVVPGVRAPDAEVTIYNPGTEVATASVLVGGRQPEGWGAVEVPPNAVTTLSVAEVEAEGPVLVEADVPVVAGVWTLEGRSAAAGASAALSSSTGVALVDLVGGGQVVPARRDPALAGRPALSATAVPTEAPPPEVEGGEGRVDATPTPTIVPLPTTTPTPSPGVSAVPTASPSPSGASEPPSAPASTQPTPAPTGTAPPGPTEATTEESLFG